MISRCASARSKLIVEWGWPSIARSRLRKRKSRSLFSTGPIAWACPAADNAS